MEEKMNYEKTTWQNGDIITAEKLNNIENGIANISNKISTITFTYHEDENLPYWTCDWELQKLTALLSMTLDSEMIANLPFIIIRFVYYTGNDRTIKQYMLNKSNDMTFGGYDDPYELSFSEKAPPILYIYNNYYWYNNLVNHWEKNESGGPLE